MRSRLAIATLLTLTTFVPGCRALHARRRHAATSARIPGPSLGPANGHLHRSGPLAPPRSTVMHPFDRVVALHTRTLGLSHGALAALDHDAAPGATALNPFDGAPVALLVPAGGDTVYAVVASPRPYVARSDDAGATWTRGASVSDAPLPPIATDPRAGNPESTPGLAANGRVVAFWYGDTVSVSHDGGATFVARDPGGWPRSLAVSHEGDVFALVHLRPPPDDEPMAVVRDPGGTARITRTLLAHDDACSAGRLFALATGGVLLGGERGLLGLCARTTQDAQHFAPYSAATDARAVEATPSGVGYVLRADGSVERPSDTTPSRLSSTLIELPWDANADGDVAIGLDDALARAPWTEADTRLGSLAREASRGTLAFAAARDVLATMDGGGLVTLVEPAPGGGVRTRRIASPCRFPRDTPATRDIPRLALDGRGHVCCASADGTGSCAAASDDAPTWHAIEGGAVAAVASGDGAIGVAGSPPRCVIDGDATTLRSRAGMAAGAHDRAMEVSCAADGTAVATVADASRLFASAFALRAAVSPSRAVRTLVPDVGGQAHVLARGDGRLVVARIGDDGLAVEAWTANGSRPVARWRPRVEVAVPSSPVPWTADSAIVSVRTGVVVLGPGGGVYRAFAADERYEAVARVGDALIGVTDRGAFTRLVPGP